MKNFKELRSQLNEDEHTATGKANRSAYTNDVISNVVGERSLNNLNAMLATIARSTFLDPIAAYNKIRVRLNIALLDFTWREVQGKTEVGQYTIPVFVRGVEGSLFLNVNVSLNADSLYVVDARLQTAADIENETLPAIEEEVEVDLTEAGVAKRLRILRKYVKPGAKPMPGEVKGFMARSFKKVIHADKTRIAPAPGSSAVKAMEVRMRKKHSAMKEKGLVESDQLDEVQKKRMLNLTGLPTDKGTISLPNTEQRPGGPGAKPSRKHPGNGLPKSGLLPGQRWSGLLGTQMNDPKKVRPEDRYLRKEEVEQIDELSPALLGRYIKKAGYSASDAANRAGQMRGAGKGKKSEAENNLYKKVNKREKGIGKAVDRLSGGY